MGEINIMEAYNNCFMNANDRLSNEEYEKLSLEYEQNPPELSGKPGFFTTMRERALVAELLPPNMPVLSI